MLARKQSIKVGDANLLDAAGEPLVAGAAGDLAGVSGGAGGGVVGGHQPGAGGATGGPSAWFKRSSFRHMVRIASIAALLSVCANTSRTFSWFPTLMLITFVVDIASATIFTLEMVLKIYARGLISGHKAYLRDRWCQFDASMVLFLWISIVLQIFEMLHIVGPYSVLSVLRSPRPLILIRFIRDVLKFSMPKARIKQIFIRSSQQIYNVTLFFLFFMSLFGLLGVQLFGQIEKHCVVNGTTLETITINSLAIPDTHCSGHPEYGNQCPPGMVCMELHLDKDIVGYNGFDHIGYSLYTVYQTSSQEGWSHLMYSTFDHYPAWRVASYFVSLVFFLGWMVRNVFIAVFTETFNEIRVQFQQMWGERQPLASEGIPRVLRGDDQGWKLVEVDESLQNNRWVPQFAKRFLNSAAFQVIVLLAILMNACLSASIKFAHDGKPRESFYNHIYWWEVAFTCFFNAETLFKMICLGFHGYLTRTSHRFELFLSIGTTINLIPQLFMSELTDFQVFRVIRLIKASPVLEDFAYKSFGPGRKLGYLVLITFCILVVTASITMQLFCSLYDYHRFQDFSYAFMSMFQILTQEAWTDVMNETMLRVRFVFGPLVAFCFIMYHLFVSLIVISIFVAAILDNLELPEDLKKAKQEKAREQIACTSEELPLRLRVFERFPDSPQMTKLGKSASEFNVPKVRESFMRSFVDTSTFDAIESRATLKNCLRTAPLGTLKGGSAAAAVTGNKPRSSQLAADSQQPQSHKRGQQTGQGASPPLRLLSGARATAGAPTGASLVGAARKSTLQQLIEQSNARRLALMSHDDPQLAISGSPGGVGVGPGGKSADVGRLARGGAGARAHSPGSSRALKHVSVSPGHAGAYDYLRDSCEGRDESSNLRNPQDLNIKMLKRKQQQAELKRSQRERDLRENHPLFDTPLLLVGRESSMRRVCELLACAKYEYNERDPITGKQRKSQYKSLHNLLGLVSYLDWLMILLTTLSCVSMMFETPAVRVSNTRALQLAEYSFVAAMSLELALKTLANGLLFTPKALLSTAAGITNALIYVTSLAYALWMPQHVQVGSLAQYLMLMRCLRPLRVFALVPHMRRVVYELVRGFKAIFLVCVLLALLCFVFACYGVHVFGGRLARCTDPMVLTRENCTGLFLRKLFVTKMRLPTDDSSYPAVLVSRVWANPHRFSFDDITSAMLALFEVLSYKGWVDIREALLKRFDSSVHTIYIHLFVFVGCMVGVTLFVGVVIANYGENKGTALLTVDQRRWCDLKKRLKIAQPLHLPPRPDHVRFRAIIYDIIQAIVFKRLIALLVLCNSSLLIIHWDPSESQTNPFATISAFLTLAFSIEVIMKMIAFTPRGYWQSRRNRYDLACTLIACVWVLVHYVMRNEFSNSFGFVVVILRFFTITGKHATLQMLMLTVVVSVYKSFFIILGLFVLVLFYSLLGVQLFGSVKFGENLSRQANFRSAKLGTITMFRIVTGEDWYRMMHDCMVGKPYCTMAPNYWDSDCGNFGLSFAFFSSFYIIITHMVLNLLVAIIMENFSLFYSSEEDALLSYTDIRNFQNTWNMVDAQQRGTIPVRRVKFILRLLKGRLEVDPTRDQHLIKHMCHEMERLHNGEDVSFHDVLSMLSYRSVDINKSLQFDELLARNELENIIEEEVAKKTIRQWLDQCLRRVKQQRHQSSLIHGLRLTNMSGADLFLPPPQQQHHQSDGKGADSTTSGHDGLDLSGGQSQSRRQLGSASESHTGAHLPSSGSNSASGSTSGAVVGAPTQAAGGGMGALAAGLGKLKRRAAEAAAVSKAPQTGSTTPSTSSAPSTGGGSQVATTTTSGSELPGSHSANPLTAIAGFGQLGRDHQQQQTPAARKLLAQEAKKIDDRSQQQLRRAIKALAGASAAAAAGTKLAKGVEGPGANQQTAGSLQHQQQASLDQDQQSGGQQQQLSTPSDATKPKLSSAICDIHQWWDYQIN